MSLVSKIHTCSSVQDSSGKRRQATTRSTRKASSRQLCSHSIFKCRLIIRCYLGSLTVSGQRVLKYSIRQARTSLDFTFSTGLNTSSRGLLRPFNFSPVQSTFLFFRFFDDRDGSFYFWGEWGCAITEKILHQRSKRKKIVHKEAPLGCFIDQFHEWY